MDNGMRGIGQLARDSGLTVSALRFYDGAGVLAPAWVDPSTNYRWYSSDQLGTARLIAGLRRVGLPLAEICQVLAARDDRRAIDEILDGHLRRLEAGLVDARRALSATRSLLDHLENPMTQHNFTVRGSDLLAALQAVRYAVGTDPELPMLTGVFFDVAGDQLTVVATDRYRMALSSAPVTDVVEGPPVIVAAELVDALLDALPDSTAVVTVAVDGQRLTVAGLAAGLTGDLIDQQFPDYRSLIRIGAGHRIEVGAEQLRAGLATAGTRTMRRDRDGVDYDVSVLAIRADGTLGFEPEPDAALQVGLNREFLLQAVDAGGAGQLVLELDGPIAPLAIRSREPSGTFGILMPTRLT